MARLEAATLAGAVRLEWFIVITWAGQEWHFCTDPTVDASDHRGAIAFHPCDPPDDLREELDPFSLDLQAASASFQVVFPFDAAARHRQGHDPEGSTVEIGLLAVKGGVLAQSWQQRTTLIRGRLVDPDTGASGRPAGWLAGTVEASLAGDGGMLHKATEVISERTWYDSDDVVTRNYGQPYPLVFGRPGRYSTPGGTAENVGSPAYLVKNEPTGLGLARVLIAGHHVVPSTVTLTDTNGDSDSLAVTNRTDSLRQPVATVDLDLTGAPLPLDRGSNAYFVTWGLSGARPRIGSSPYANGAGDVLLWALTRTGLEVDWAEWLRLRSALNTYQLDFYVDAEARAWEWLTSEVLPLLPIGVAVGTRGITPVELPGYSARSQALRMYEGPDFRRTSPLRAVGGGRDLLNTMRAEYAFSPDTDKPRGAAVIEGGSVRAPSHARASADRYGDRSDSISLRAVYHRATAERGIGEMVRRRALADVEADFQGAMRWGWIPLRQRLLVDEASTYTERRGLVVGKAWNGTRWTFRVRFSDGPPVSRFEA